MEEGEEEEEVDVLLASCVAGDDGAAASRLEDLATKQELRDVDWAVGAAEGRARVDSVRKVVLRAWKKGLVKDRFLGKMMKVVAALLALDGDEMPMESRRMLLGDIFPIVVLENAELGPLACPGLWEKTLHESFVVGDEKLRGSMRQKFGDVLIRLNGNDAVPLNETELETLASVLSLLRVIVKGFRTPLSSEDAELLTRGLVPLHKVQGKLSPSTASLSAFHKPLVECVLAFLEKDERLIDTIVKSLLVSWPDPKEGNSPKEVLLLQELEVVLKYGRSMKAVNISIVANKLGQCISSSHSTVCQRALTFWKNDDVVAVLYDLDRKKGVVVGPICRAVLSEALGHWNFSVKAKARKVLLELNEYSPELVANAAKQALSTMSDEERSTFVKNAIEEANEVNEGSAGPKREVYVPEKRNDVSFMNMVIAEELGHGTFSRVFRALMVEKGKSQAEWTVYAVKRILVDHKHIAEREAVMMDKIDHPLCTRLVGMYESIGAINLVLEFAENGDLHTLLASLGSLDVDSVKFVSAEVASALDAVHRAGLLFGDLKPENVLVHANGHVKLGDFGATRELSLLQQHNENPEGTLCYLAPELFSKSGAKDVPEAVDWWAFGCLIYQMMTGRPPLWVEEERELVNRLVHFEVEKFPAGFLTDAEEVITAFLNPDPKSRLCSDTGGAEFMVHPFMQDFTIDLDEIHLQQAPKFDRGELQPEEGPWTQRTYSMMQAPVPESYGSGGSRFSEWETIRETEVDQKQPWFSSMAFQGRVGGRKPMLASFTESPSIVAGGLPPPQIRGRGARGPQQPSSKGKYMFKGLDLSAG